MVGGRIGLFGSVHSSVARVASVFVAIGAIVAEPACSSSDEATDLTADSSVSDSGAQDAGSVTDSSVRDSADSGVADSGVSDSKVTDVEAPEGGNDTLPVLPENDPKKNYVGLNVWFLNDWDGSQAFVDAMKHARPWQDAAKWQDPVGGIDALGWPTADASTVLFTGTPAAVNGTYKLIFNGQADVSLLWYGGSVANKTYDAKTNTTTAEVIINSTSKGSGGLVFKNTKRTESSAVNTGFTNVRLYRPGYLSDGSEVFTKPFLKALGKTSAVRMMDWTSTNQNVSRQWSERNTPLHMSKVGPSYTGPGGLSIKTSDLGVALEHQIQLCNALKSDCWINIPVAADDDYVHKIALALRYGTDGTNPYSSHQANPVYPALDPGVRLYLEYANEIWNSAGGFDCFGIIEDIVKTLPAGHELLTPAESSVWYKMWRYPAYRIAGISDIFRSVYGNASMMNRVRPVLMTQQGNGQATLQTALGWMDAYGHRQTPVREISSYIYGAGGSGYYGVNKEPANQTDLNAFFATGNYPSTENVKGIGIDAVWAANFGLKRIAYEGGPSLDNFSDANANAINMDARMQDMVVKTHDAWSNQGGDLLMYYTLVGAPKWEFTPDITNASSPKFKAVDQLQSQARAAVTQGQQLPGTIIATDEMDLRIRTGTDYATTCDTLACIGGNDAGEWIALPAHASAQFAGSIVVNGISNSATTLAIWVNGVKAGEVTLPAGSKLANSSSLSVSIPAGLVAIRIEVVSGGINLRSISIK